MAGDLDRIGIRWATDKSSRRHGYLTYYEKYLEPIRYKPITLLEIGVRGGHSLRTWESYFPNPNARFWGLDIRKEYKHKSKRTGTFMGRQEERPALKKIVDRVGVFDVIIDDGGHFMNQQQISLGFLFPSLKSGGVYVIEDLHTSNDPKFNQTATTNTTLHLIQEFCISRRICSDFMLKSEIAYLEISIQKCILETQSLVFLIKK